MSGDRLTWKQTFTCLRADRRRLSDLLLSEALNRGLSFHPSFVCVVLFRISHHFYRNGHRWIARLFWHLNVVVTGADISEPNELGEGLLIVSPPGTAIMARAGRNLTIMPCAGLGGELGRWEDVGAGPGLPVVGDDVTLEPHCGVLGPITIGNRVRLTAGTVVTENVPDDMIVEGPKAKVVRRSDL